MKYTGKKFYYLMIVSFLAMECLFAFDLPFNQYYARVKNKSVNVRARSSTSSEIMYQLKKRDDILVIGESGDWLKIRPNEGFFAYIHKDLVEDGIIVKNNVNVRAGPSLSSSILGRMKEGDPVLTVRTQDEWLVIEMPRGIGFWVAKFLTDFLCPSESYQEYLIREKEAGKRFKEAEGVRKDELTKRYLDVDHDKIIKIYQMIIDEFPETSEALKAQERIIDAREKKAMTRQKKTTFKELKRLILLYDEAEQKREVLFLQENFSKEALDSLITSYQHIVNNYPGTKEGRASLEKMEELNKIKAEKQIEWDKLKGFKATGKLKVYRGRDYLKATHVLIKGGFNRKVTCALYCNNIDLRAYEKKQVFIEGKKVSDETSIASYPLVEVEKIFLK